MVLRFLAISSILFFGSCRDSGPKYSRISDKIFTSYAKELQKQNGLFLQGKGGAMMNDVEMVGGYYLSFADLTVDQARKLYIEVLEGYLERYNNNEEIRPYLHNYPFTIKNIELRIAFEDESGRRRDGNSVAFISLVEGNIYYRGYDHEKKDFTDLHDEPYEEAVRIVRGG